MIKSSQSHALPCLHDITRSFGRQDKVFTVCVITVDSSPHTAYSAILMALQVMNFNDAKCFSRIDSVKSTIMVDGLT